MNINKWEGGSLLWASIFILTGCLNKPTDTDSILEHRLEDTSENNCDEVDTLLEVDEIGIIPQGWENTISDELDYLEQPSYGYFSFEGVEGEAFVKLKFSRYSVYLRSSDDCYLSYIRVTTNFNIEAGEVFSSEYRSSIGIGFIDGERVLSTTELAPYEFSGTFHDVREGNFVLATVSASGGFGMDADGYDVFLTWNNATEDHSRLRLETKFE